MKLSVFAVHQKAKAKTRDGYRNPVFNRSRGYIIKDRSIDKL